jgi:predicted RND superfamily exporter protein
MLRRVAGKLIDFSGRHPFVVLLLTLSIIASCGYYAFLGPSRLQLRSDILELLPRDSPGFKAFEHQLGRVGGGASLIVIAESPEREKNRAFIDELAKRLQSVQDEHAACESACADDGCRAGCGPRLISYLETGTKEVHSFFENYKWLYADLKDLEDADQTLDRQIAIQSGLVEDLEDDERPRGAVPAATPGKDLESAVEQGSEAAAAAAASVPTTATDKKPALGMDEFRERWKAKAKKNDDFPSGYFETDDGTMVGLRIVSMTTGTGDALGDRLMQKVRAIADELGPSGYHPDMQVGFAGDIPNAVAEKDSLVSDSLLATAVAFVLILGGVVFFYRSPWSLVVIAVPALFGIGCAYAFATATYGYVNTSGAFLGAIILGNGINYPIVLLSRYKEFRARGQAPDVARREAVFNAFRAELVGASVAAIAYGSLTITRFRGFNQFGMIGFVGMLLVWVAIVPVVPALIVLIEKLQTKLPSFLRDPEFRLAEDGSHGPFTRFAANTSERMPWVILVLSVALTVVAAWKLPSYFADPWEYNFDKLGSRGSKQGGAGEWSNKAERVFGGKMNIAGALMLADTPEQVPALKAQIYANDAKDPEGQLIADIATVYDLLPGTREEQEEKLEVLERIRERLTPGVLARMEEGERTRVEEIRPPEELRAIGAGDLPALLRRRFEENDGRVGTVFYVKYKNDVSLSDGRNLLRIARATDNVELPDGTLVQTASRSTIFAEMIRSMERDGPLATAASFLAVVLVVLIATSSLRGAIGVITALVMGVVWTFGGAAFLDQKLNFLNFIALPITFGIGCEYPFNIFDRSRLLRGDVTSAVKRSGGAVALCSYTTIIGYGSMLVSDQQALQSFGRLAMAGELACLFTALFFLPALLHLFNRFGWGGWRTPRSEQDRAVPSVPPQAAAAVAEPQS